MLLLRGERSFSGEVNLFLVLFAAVALLGLAAGMAVGAFPVWIGWVYFGASLWTVVLYAWDKQRARRARGRIAERTLHFLELAGGWPGALLAQRILRHKNQKFSYQRTFWLIVLLHLCAWAAVGVWMMKSAG